MSHSLSNQVDVFKIVNGHEIIDPNIFVKIKAGKRTRGHHLTLVKGQSGFDVWKYYFFLRTINKWNIIVS